ncbi:MAG: HD domain-containing protein [Desulfatitalea sp.]
MTDENTIYRNLHAWLLEHIATIPCTDERMRRHLDLKRTHSLRVAEDIVRIGRRLGLDDHALLIARTIGLLHDVGRFEQYKVYHTYNDRISTDHGALGARIVAANGLLAPFSAEEAAIITQAICLHNKIALPDQESEAVVFFLKLIRDADKLDIYRVILENLADAGQALFEAVIPTAADVSEEIYAVLMRGGNVDYQLAANGTDRLMMHVGWVFDINFVPTLQLIAERGYLETIAAALPATPRVAGVLAKARAHLAKHTPTITTAC